MAFSHPARHQRNPLVCFSTKQRQRERHSSTTRTRLRGAFITTLIIHPVRETEAPRSAHTTRESMHGVTVQAYKERYSDPTSYWVLFASRKLESCSEITWAHHQDEHSSSLPPQCGSYYQSSLSQKTHQVHLFSSILLTSRLIFHHAISSCHFWTVLQWYGGLRSHFVCQMYVHEFDDEFINPCSGVSVGLT